MKQSEGEGILPVHKTRAGRGTGRSCAMMLRVGAFHLSITHLLGTNAREHLSSLVWQQRNLKISIYPSHSSKGPELLILKAPSIIT